MIFPQQLFQPDCLFSLLPTLSDFIKSLLVEIILGLFIWIFKKLRDFFVSRKFEYKLCGYWKNTHENPKLEKIVEIIKLKQTRSEIKATIWQYKINEYKKYYGRGIVNGNLIMMYYVGNGQSGMLALEQDSDFGGNIRLTGEYLEGVDLKSRNKNRRKNQYILEPMKLNRFKWIMLRFKKNRFEYVKKIIGLGDDK